MTLSEVDYHPPQTLVFCSCTKQEGSTCACETAGNNSAVYM